MHAYVHGPWPVDLCVLTPGGGVSVKAAGGAVPRSKKTEGVAPGIHVIMCLYG